MAHPSWHRGGLGPDGALHGAGHLQVPEGGARGPLLPAGQSSRQPEAGRHFLLLSGSLVPHVDQTLQPYYTLIITSK